MSFNFFPSGRRAVIVGNPFVDKTGCLYEAAFKARGLITTWVELDQVLKAAINGDGVSLLDSAIDNPFVCDVQAEQYFLPAGAFGIEPGTAVLIVSNEYNAYAWALTQIFTALGAVQPNSAQAMRSARNKWITHVAFREAGLPVAEAALVHNVMQLRNAGRVLGYPLVVKELEGTQGTGVRLARDERELLECAEELSLFMQPLMVEHYIEVGAMDRRVVMVDDLMIGAMQRHAPQGDFRANIALGGYGHPCDISARQLELVRNATRALRLRFVGMDLGVVKEILPGRSYLSVESTFLIEANAMPGLAGLRDATDVDASTALVDVLINQAEVVDRSVG